MEMRILVESLTRLYLAGNADSNAEKMVTYEDAADRLTKRSITQEEFDYITSGA